MKKYIFSRKKIIINFITSFIVMYLILELIEYLLHYFYDIDLHNLYVNESFTFLSILFFGYKYHIICCLIPLIYSTYKCKHEKCTHDHCEK